MLLILGVMLVVETILLLVVLAHREHRHGKISQPVPPPQPATPHLTQADLERLNAAAQQAFATAVEEGAKSFHADLTATSQQLNKLINNITTDVIQQELEEYRQSLATAREEALASLKAMQGAAEQKQQALEGDVDAELAKRRQYLMERLDKSLGAAVAAYVVESLGVNADLGAQKSFLLENLERHKKEIKQEVNDGRSA